MLTLTKVDPVHRDGVRATAKEWIRRALELAAQIEADRQLSTGGLGELFPVRQGLGAALLWTPLTSVQTADPEAHFASMRHELHLAPVDQRRRRRITSRLPPSSASSSRTRAIFGRAS